MKSLIIVQDDYNRHVQKHISSQFQKNGSDPLEVDHSTLFFESLKIADGRKIEVHKLRQEKENLWKEIQLQHESMKKELQDYREEVMRDVRDIMQEMRGKRARYSSPSEYDDFVE
ncbi:hypothetical protein ACFE04_001417 [Oxalis oulophora]